MILIICFQIHMFQTCNNFNSDSNSNSIFFQTLYEFNFHSLQLCKSPESLLSWIITLLALWADDPSGLGQPVGLQRVVRTAF